METAGSSDDSSELEESISDKKLSWFAIEWLDCELVKMTG